MGARQSQAPPGEGPATVDDKSLRKKRITQPYDEETASELPPSTEGDEDEENIYLVELDVIGFENRVFIEAYGTDADAACDCAQETLASRKWNDCSVESVSQKITKESWQDDA